MTPEQFQHLLDRHGADPTHWPQAQRVEAVSLMARSAEARDLHAQTQRLDALIQSFARPKAEDETAAARVMTRLAGTLPRQRMAFWRWPAALINFDLSPSWPRMAALAGCAVVGFMVGLAGLDRRFDPTDAPSVLNAGRDLGSIFEAEPVSGDR